MYSQKYSKNSTFQYSAVCLMNDVIPYRTTKQTRLKSFFDLLIVHLPFLPLILFFGSCSFLNSDCISTSLNERCCTSVSLFHLIFHFAMSMAIVRSIQISSSGTFCSFCSRAMSVPESAAERISRFLRVAGFPRFFQRTFPAGSAGSGAGRF